MRHLSLVALFACLLAGACVVAGCDANVTRFAPNQVQALAIEHSRDMPTEAALHDVQDVIGELFGSPDQPRWPAELLDSPELQSLVDPQRLARAAGPVFSDREGVHSGLFREHCVVCHGLGGSGAGPASRLQNPYPRDFRRGTFKWKSTERAAKPTRADLVELLRRGVPGTAMPSYAVVHPEDLEALVDYVIYLAVRGETERKLLALAVDELGYDESAPAEPSLRLSPVSLTSNIQARPTTEADELIIEVLQQVASGWAEADRAVVPVPPPPTLGSQQALADSLKRGSDLFHGQIANCVGCHGPAGNGEAVTLDFDDWTKDFTTRVGVTPSDQEAVEPFRDAGALPPRAISPRNLRDGVFRGGGEPETIYRRISEGIAGTPMPSLQIADAESGTGLTPEQVWDLVRYVLSLSGQNGN